MTNLSGTNLNNGSAVGPQGEGRDSPSTFPAYPAYRDSGVEWLGEVPHHWESRRLKFLFSLQKRPVVDSDGIVTCFRDGAVTLRANRRTDGFTNAEKEIGYQGIRRGDLVIHAMDAFAGAIGVSDSDGKSSPVYSACTPNEGVSAYYYARLLRHMALAGFVSSLAKGIRERSTDFRWSDASEIYLPFPSISEQTQIARFLDHETARIDALIEEQQRLIELLKEKRQAVISHAVTKGLDPTVPMKDSGVEWLGEVPAHWGGRKFFFGIQKIIDNRGRSPSYVDSGIPILEARQLSDEGMECSSDFTKYISEESHSEFVRDDVVAGDVLMVTVGTIGKVGMVGENPGFVILQNIVGFRVGSDIDPGFMAIYLKSGAAFMAMQATNKESILSSVKVSDFIQHKMPLPPLAEQKAIVYSVNTELSKYGELQKEAELLCSTLHERRSALISAAVTGKIDVRGWQPPANAQAPESAVAEAN